MHSTMGWDSAKLSSYEDEYGLNNPEADDPVDCILRKKSNKREHVWVKGYCIFCKEEQPDEC
jgi:hypothetical protein